MNIRNSIKIYYFRSRNVYFITHFFTEYVIFKYLLQYNL
ncbi:stress response small protein YobI [Escherichia coli]